MIHRPAGPLKNECSCLETMTVRRPNHIHPKGPGGQRMLTYRPMESMPCLRNDRLLATDRWPGGFSCCEYVLWGNKLPDPDMNGEEPERTTE